MLALAGCRGGPSLAGWTDPAPAGPAVSPAAARAALAEAKPPRTLYAELSLRHRGERDGVFEAVVLFDAEAATLRMSASKDLVVSSRAIFELRLAGDEVTLQIDEGDAPLRYRGPRQELPPRLGAIAGLIWAERALFVPGCGELGEARAGLDGHLIPGRLPSGAAVTWMLRPDGRVLGAELVAPGGAVFQMRYRGRRDGLPTEVLLVDEAGSETTATLIEHERDTPIEPETLELELEAGPP